jgi:DNA polymerase I-like protein with 3'-5' exonuclease and polymerase domains
MTEFPGLKALIDQSTKMAQTQGYVETILGRRRNLPAMRLKEVEVKAGPGYKHVDKKAFDPTDFDNDMGEVETELSKEVRRRWATALVRARGQDRVKVVSAARAQNIIVTDNGGRIAEASRQCLNSRVQGSAADACKVAIVELHKNKRLKELECVMLLPIHDEILFECPRENIREASIIVKEVMEHCVDRWWSVPNVCDVVVTDSWSGNEVEV